MGCAKWVPRATRSVTARTIAGCAWPDQRDAVAAVQVDVLRAVDVVDLRPAPVAEPDRLRLGDLPARGGAARERPAGPGAERGRRRLPPQEQVLLLGDDRVQGRRGRADRRRPRDACHAHGLPHCRCSRTRLYGMLTERSVYASVLPPSQGRRGRRSRCPSELRPTPSQADRPTRVPRPDEPRRPRRPGPARGARRLLVRHPGSDDARVLGLAGLQDRVAVDPGDLAGRRGRPDRRRPRAGEGRHPQLYNYADYIGPGVVKAFEKKYAAYNVKVRVSTFNDTDEALTKIRGRQVRLRHLLPELRPDREDGDGQADPAAQPQLHPQHRQRLAGVHRPLVRRRVALHRALHASTRPASAGGPTRSPSTSRRCRTPTTSFWDTELRPQDRRHRRLAHRDGDGGAARRHHRHQHHEADGPREDPGT